MRFSTCLLTSGAIVLAISSCQRDQVAPDCFLRDDNGKCIEPSGAPPEPGALSVDCGMPPLGAVDADYRYAVDFEGDKVSFTAEGLPNGLTITGSTGEIVGVPTDMGTFSEAVITITDDESGVSKQAECPDIEIAPALDHDLFDLPPDAPYGCLPMGADINDHLSGGDETDVRCSFEEKGMNEFCPYDEGNGLLPEGLTFDEDTCAATGSIAEDHMGTYVWIVAVEQSGNTVHVPFCATKTLDGSFHDVAVTLDGNAGHDPLAPAILAYDPAAPLDFGDDTDPRFNVTDECPGASCDYFGFRFERLCSPFNEPFVYKPRDFLYDNMMNPIGFFHSVIASTHGSNVGDEINGDRTWVVNFKFWYCTSDTQPPCDPEDDNAIFDNAQTQYTFSVLAHPQ